MGENLLWKKDLLGGATSKSLLKTVFYYASCSDLAEWTNIAPSRVISLIWDRAVTVSKCFGSGRVVKFSVRFRDFRFGSTFI